MGTCFLFTNLMLAKIMFFFQSTKIGQAWKNISIKSNKKILFRFDEDLEAIYAELFAPMCITRQQFQKLCSVKVLGTYPKVLNFHSGECYSIQDMTKTDRLALCLRG